MSGVDHDARSPARVSETNSPRPGIIATALTIVATAAAGLILTSAVMALEWLGGRSWAIVVSGVLALMAVWWPWGRHTGAVWAACGGLAAATRLGRVARGDPMPRAEWLPPGDYEYVAGMSDRILGRDLPAVGVYAIVIAAAILMVICVILALPWRGRVTVIGRRALVLGTLGGGLAAALMVASTITAAGAVRIVADRRADTAAVTATVSRPAERLDQTSGPSRPAKIAWTFEPPQSDGFAEGFIGVAAVPGWDALIAAIRHYPVTDEGPDLRSATTRIVALSKTDGSQLWQYWRHDGAVQGAAVDPDAGRVLLFADQTTVTLDLSDGSQLSASVPDPWRAARGNLVDSRFMEEGFHRGAVVTLGPTAVSWNYQGDESLTVFDVAGGEVLATTDPHAGCSYAAATTASPVIVEWGCGAPQVLSLAGPELVRTPITGPDVLAGFLMECHDCTAEDLVVTDDTIVISVEGGDEVQDDIVAISFDGEVRWHASQANDQIQGGDVDLIAVTGDRVVAQWDDHWRVLSLTDGTERVRQRHDCSGGYSTVAYNAVSDGERIYTPCDDRLVVFGIDDLTPSWDEGPRLQGWDLAFPGDGFFIAVQSIGPPERVMAIGHQ